MKAKEFKNLNKPVSAEKKAAMRAEREALALYEEQLTRMCWRKFGYVDNTKAARAAGKALTRDPTVTLRAYKCPACIYWHLTRTKLA